MDELSAKLIELIEKGEGAVDAHGMELTTKWVEYVFLTAWWDLIFGLGLLVGASAIAFLARFMFRWSHEIKASTRGSFDEGVGTFIGGCLSSIGAAGVGFGGLGVVVDNIPVIIEPVGYLVHQIVRAAT